MAFEEKPQEAKRATIRKGWVPRMGKARKDEGATKSEIREQQKSRKFTI